MSEPFWTGRCRLYWRADDYGNAGRALYLGGLQVGSIICSFDRKMPWFGWIMTDADGKKIGPSLTEREAKDALEDAVVTQILGEPPE